MVRRGCERGGKKGRERWVRRRGEVDERRGRDPEDSC